MPTFFIPSYVDKVLIDKLDSTLAEGGYKRSKLILYFIFTNHATEFEDEEADLALRNLIGTNSIFAHKIVYHLDDWAELSVERPWDRKKRVLSGKLDTVKIQPHGMELLQAAGDFARLITIARKELDAQDG
jgi:hypothetical protein